MILKSTRTGLSIQMVGSSNERSLIITALADDTALAYVLDV